MRLQLTKPVAKLYFANAPLGTVLQYLQDASKANIFVDWRALATVKVTKSTKMSPGMTNVPLDLVMELLTQKLRGVGYTAAGGCIEGKPRIEDAPS